MTWCLIPWGYLLPQDLIAPAGTRLFFNQSAPPVGWTQDTSAAFNDTALRTVTSAGGGTGGSTGFSSWFFGGTFNVNAFTISVAQMAAHNHSMSSSHGHGIGSGTSANEWIQSGSSSGGFGAGNLNVGFGSFNGATTGVTLQNNGSGASVTPNYTTPQIKYTNLIIGIKS